MSKINVGIIGGAGYTGGELIRVLIHHPNANIVFILSKSCAGKRIDTIHDDLIGDTDIVFTNSINYEIDVLFLCVAHGVANNFLLNNTINEKVVIIDLSQDNRIGNNQFVYGLPELFKSQIKNAKKIANPGCFATAIQLALLPLANQNLIQSTVHINATTGSTGAGQSLSDTTHFSWRHNNVSVYKAFTHQHLLEIEFNLNKLQQLNHSLIFIPQRGAFARGIIANIVLEDNNDLSYLTNLYKQYYFNEPFVKISENPIHLKQVVNTNKCIIHLQKHNNQLCIISIIDNLLKGAVGQAVQNMNLIFNLPENAGLQLKSIAF